MNLLFDATLSRLEHGLDVRLRRHDVLADNLANADTPGFTPRDVDLAAEFAAPPRGASAAAPLAGAAPRGASGAEGAAAYAPEPQLPGEQLHPPLIDAPMTAAGLDGNAVDLDRTMAALAQNALQYGATARAAGKKLAILRYVVSDGNG
jgi:flagellar basal-body rod protein FlgB